MKKQEFEMHLNERAANLDKVRPEWKKLLNEWVRHSLLADCSCSWSDYINDNYKKIPAELKVNGWYDTFGTYEAPKEKRNGRSKQGRTGTSH